MQRISLIEFFIRAIPESLIFVWASYALSRTKLQYNRYFLSVILMSIIAFGIRFLPIQYGANIPLGIAVLVIINAVVNKIKIIKSIFVTLSVYIIEMISEIINLLMIKYIFRVDTEYVFSHPLIKTLYGLPSLLLLIVLIFIIKTLLNRRINKQITLDN